MNEAIIYIAHHPNALPKFVCMQRRYAGKHVSVLVVCEHLYTTPDVIRHYSGGFDHVMILPDLKYETNLFRMALKFNRFIRLFKNNIAPILGAVSSFNVVSNASAFPPVNVLLSRLRASRKCRYSISITDELVYEPEIDILKTAYLLFVAMVFGMYPCYFHKRFAYYYIRYPIDRILRFNSAFFQKSPLLHDRIMSMPVYNVFEMIDDRTDSEKDMVIFYGEWTVFSSHEYGCSLSYEEYKKRLTLFFLCLSKYYRGCKLVYKPHPLDSGKIMPGLDRTKFEIYGGALITELHLDMNIGRVKACYSVSSTSLRYSSSKGVPSYTLYKYLEFKNKYPAVFFEDKKVSANPFLLNISDINEIGKVDNISVAPIKNNDSEAWDRLMDFADNR